MNQHQAGGSVEVHCIPHLKTSTCTYVVSDPATKKCALIDTAADYEHASGSIQYTHADSVIQHVQDNGLTVMYILETHVHADHLSAAQYIKGKVGGAIAIGLNVHEVQETFAPRFGVEIKEEQFDLLLEDAQTLPLGDLTVEVMCTPGHTPACVSYLVGDAVFTGDTLFHMDIGTARCDFPGGSVEEMWKSCQRLLALPEATRNFIGHDYPGNRRPFTCCVTIGEQKASNKMVKAGTTMEEFSQMRTKRDAGLNAPALLLPSIQVNIMAGRLPKALTIPLSVN
mmetsp:Transcript_24919/g.27574  ORF Transcript_24919/g.27574 Transcript_24919/m.27574 type:complete len:283 (+) Transcript_24919:25-873(+)|eukprot:CAMPEP_0205830696 /NCGR_PEP_ID=MMETSP0206-20130828/41903_1 /ASSEMBLY_ACC=CAM_ASM_000279 /TAXON_ID=36767 /ORGANISM="Euplotes focardii, Strain TN1" /LENGTH=282 /DNA_ID=CAMNT_0053134605 /DNA_START=23 /DNA_END=871 /DNA_ORIENTATION=-